MVDALSHAGLSPVVVKCDGVEALTWLHQNPPPRVVLLDVRLPRADGHEISKYIATDESLAGVPIILISGAELEPAAFPRVVAFLRKPVTADQLVAAVKRACGAHDHATR